MRRQNSRVFVQTWLPSARHWLYYGSLRTGLLTRVSFHVNIAAIRKHRHVLNLGGDCLKSLTWNVNIRSETNLAPSLICLTRL